MPCSRPRFGTRWRTCRADATDRLISPRTARIGRILRAWRKSPDRASTRHVQRLDPATPHTTAPARLTLYLAGAVLSVGGCIRLARVSASGRSCVVSGSRYGRWSTARFRTSAGSARGVETSERPGEIDARRERTRSARQSSGARSLRSLAWVLPPSSPPEHAPSPRHWMGRGGLLCVGPRDDLRRPGPLRCIPDRAVMTTVDVAPETR